MGGGKRGIMMSTISWEQLDDALTSSSVGAESKRVGRCEVSIVVRFPRDRTGNTRTTVVSRDSKLTAFLFFATIIYLWKSGVLSCGAALYQHVK